MDFILPHVAEVDSRAICVPSLQTLQKTHHGVHNIKCSITFLRVPRLVTEGYCDLCEFVEMRVCEDPIIIAFFSFAIKTVIIDVGDHDSQSLQ